MARTPCRACLLRQSFHNPATTAARSALAYAAMPRTPVPCRACLTGFDRTSWSLIYPGQGLSAHLPRPRAQPCLADVAVQRWHHLTGERATLDKDGADFDSVAAARSAQAGGDQSVQ